ncbi:hypothetical protein SAMN05444414_10628 [Roseovarius marisflavi]|uniref:Uncharacterized protein n=1 Tax=Roseovarius marisflavi TaxID=1054996 RepID=A0A1M6Y9G6_9RHOB|nr:hypothetical protein SAMN05444414_10628 [Roseovarius marisflavi]
MSLRVPLHCFSRLHQRVAFFHVHLMRNALPFMSDNELDTLGRHIGLTQSRCESMA